MRNPGHTSIGRASVGMQAGLATLGGGTGTATVANAARIDPNTSILCTRMTAGAGAGWVDVLGSVARVNGDPGTFGLQSSAAGDTSQFQWIAWQNIAGFGPLGGASGYAEPHTEGAALGSAVPAVQRVNATMAGLANVVAVPFVDANTVFYFQRLSQGPGTAPGHLTQGAIVAGSPGSVTVNSSNAAEDGDVAVYAFQPAAMRQAGSYYSGNAPNTLPAFQTGVAGPVSPAVTVVTARISGSAPVVILIQRTTLAGTPGWPRISASVPGDPGSFTITSSNALDTSTFRWIIIDPTAFA